MSRSPEIILKSWLTELLPSGSAWSKDSHSNLARLLMPLAQGRAALEEDLDALMFEISPATSTLLLSDYQTVLGSDPYGRDIGELSTAQTQALLFSRWVARGGQSIAYYIGLGAAMGVTLAIYEPQARIYGGFVYGDGNVCSEADIDNFTWVVTLPQAGTGIEAIILANRQPDTDVVFRYGATSGFGDIAFGDWTFGA